MATATRKRFRIALREGVVYQSGPLKVDRDKGIIFDVKALGWESENGRRYDPEAGRRAIPLYENVDVFCDHPDRPEKNRSVSEALGKLRGVRWKADGLYGDLHYNREHPMAKAVCEDVERGLGNFGLSHNADGDGRVDRDGTKIVENITDVRSVDLVTRPATTTNLWESKTMKLREHLEALKKTATGQAAKTIAALLEDDTIPADMVAPAEEDPGDWKQDLLSAVAKLLDSSDADDVKRIDAIMKLIKPPKEETPTEEEEDDEDDKDMKDAQEQIKSLKAREKTREACEKLCEQMEVVPSRLTLKALMGLDNDAERKDYLKEQKGNVAKRGGARSQGAERFTESKNGKEFKDDKEFLKLITA